MTTAAVAAAAVAAADAAATVAVAAAAPTNDGNQPENADTPHGNALLTPHHDWATLLRCKSLVTLPKRCCCSFSLLNKTAATLLLATSLPPPLPCQHNTLTFFPFQQKICWLKAAQKKNVQPAFRHEKAATGVAFSVTSFAVHLQRVC